MITRKYREYEAYDDDMFFIVSDTKDGMFNELKEYCKQHPNTKVWFHKHPVRPSNINYRPEHMMEVQINSDFELLYQRYQ